MLKPGLRAGRLLAASAMAVAGASEAAETVTYGYDALGRLTASSSAGTVNNGVATSVRYDPAGNRSSYAVAGVGGGGGGGGGGEPPPGAVFAVGDSSAAEGGSLVFVVTRSGGTGGSSSVAYATADGSAAAGSDYQATSGTLSFAAAETSKTVTVAGIEDGLDETEETVLLNLSGASAGASISDSQGVGTLGDNDDPPPPPPGAVFAVGDSSAAEGGSLVFIVTKSGGTGGASSVSYATANGSAAAGSDYQAASGTLSFAAAETSKTVAVAGMEDSLNENSETVLLDLSGASAGASISDSQGVGTLGDNDDPAPPPPPSNNPPTAKNNSGSQAKCTTALYDVVSDDTDIDGDIPLALVSVDGIGFTILSTTTVQFASTASSGPKVGTYVVQDRRGATASAKLTVTVSGGTCNSQAPAPGPLPSAATGPEGEGGS